MSVLANRDVVKPLAQTGGKEALGEREPLRLFTLIFVALMAILFVVVVIVLGDNEGAAIVVGVAGLVILGVVQMVVLRKKIFSPSTVAEIIEALAGKKGLEDVKEGKGNEVEDRAPGG